MSKIAVIGSDDSLDVYRAVGFDTFLRTSPIDASHLLRELAEKEYAVVYITEDLYKAMDTAVSRYSYRCVPAVISLPGIGGTDGSGMSALERAVKLAVGSDAVK